MSLTPVPGTASAAKPPDKSLADRIVWIDCEMTGLSLAADALVEVAALVTDYELNQLGDGVDVVIKPPALLHPRVGSRATQGGVGWQLCRYRSRLPDS